MSLIFNSQSEETWAKFALAEAMEELRAAEDRKHKGCAGVRLPPAVVTVSKKKGKAPIIGKDTDADRSYL